MGWDEISDISWEDDNHDEGKDEDGNLHLSDKVFKKFIEKNYQVIKKVEQIGLPKTGEQLRLITMHPFNTISIISYIAEKEVIEKAIFVIFAINQSAARVIIDLHKKGRVREVVLIVSQIRNAGHISKSRAVDMLREHFDVIYVNSHAKISLLKTDAGNYYNIEGSGNFSFNGRLEQYVIDNDIGLYEFSKQWIDEIKKFTQK